VDIKLTNPTRPGDRVDVSGKLTRKYVQDGRHFVVCEVTAVKQNGSLVATGTVRAHVPC
jgi:acyl dehydratase